MKANCVPSNTFQFILTGGTAPFSVVTTSTTSSTSVVTNPQTGIALKENLLGKCQRCHPDATANFPDAWMSHYEPSPQVFPVVYYVNLFYKFFIPAVIGGMIFYILTDIYRRFVVPRLRGGKGASHK